MERRQENRSAALYRLTAAAVAAAVLLSCRNPVPPAPPPAWLHWNTRVFEKRAEDCAVQEPCPAFRVEYPVFDLAATPAALARLNERAATLARGDGSASVEDQAAAFIIEETPARLGQRFLRREVRVLYQGARHIVLEFSEYGYTGGAEPRQLRRYENLWRMTGTPFGWDALFEPQAMAELDRRWPRTASFAILGPGLLVAPDGNPELERLVRWAEIRELLRKDGPIP